MHNSCINVRRNSHYSSQLTLSRRIHNNTYTSCIPADQPCNIFSILHSTLTRETCSLQHVQCQVCKVALQQSAVPTYITTSRKIHGGTRRLCVSEEVARVRICDRGCTLTTFDGHIENLPDLVCLVRKSRYRYFA